MAYLTAIRGKRHVAGLSAVAVSGLPVWGQGPSEVLAVHGLSAVAVSGLPVWGQGPSRGVGTCWQSDFQQVQGKGRQHGRQQPRVKESPGVGQVSNHGQRVGSRVLQLGVGRFQPATCSGGNG